MVAPASTIWKRALPGPPTKVPPVMCPTSSESTGAPAASAKEPAPE